MRNIFRLKAVLPSWLEAKLPTRCCGLIPSGVVINDFQDFNQNMDLVGNRWLMEQGWSLQSSGCNWASVKSLLALILLKVNPVHPTGLMCGPGAQTILGLGWYLQHLVNAVYWKYLGGRGQLGSFFPNFSCFRIAWGISGFFKSCN